MFQQFSHWARQAVALAQDEARELGHPHVGAEHLLLGLRRVPGGSAPGALRLAGIDLDAARKAVDAVAGGTDRRSGDIVPFAPSLKRALDGAVATAGSAGGEGLGTGELLESILRTDEVGKVLAALHVDRDHIVAALERERATDSADHGPEPAPEHHVEPHCPRCRSLLSERARTETRQVPADEGGTRQVVFVYCEACGISLAATVLPD